jgi:hypothetical protein
MMKPYDVVHVSVFLVSQALCGVVVVNFDKVRVSRYFESTQCLIPTTLAWHVSNSWSVNRSSARWLPGTRDIDLNGSCLLVED